MRSEHTDEKRRERQRGEEKRLQTGAALVLGLAVLVVIVLRAGVGNVFTPGWWRL